MRRLTLALILIAAAAHVGEAHAAGSPNTLTHRLVPRATIAAVPGRHDTQVSGNWSGYAITGPTFTDVQGSWTVPQVSCSDSDTYSSYWIGLGGFLAGDALEQTGTDSYCIGGQQVFDAWYEIIPAPPVEFDLVVDAGETITAEVTVDGTQTTLTLTDETTGQTAEQTVEVDQPDLTAAEWIAEAPASCPAGQACQVMPLANFDTMTFSGAQATSDDGHTGTISDSSWAQTAITLAQDTTFAVPSDLASDGSGFTVAYETGSPTPPPAPAPTVVAPPATDPPATTPPSPPAEHPKPVKPKKAKPSAHKSKRRHRAHPRQRR